jgi:predicted nucleic acid-binding protein
VGLGPYYLADTSALARLSKPPVREHLAPLIEAGLVARCTPTDLEAGFSARGRADYRCQRQARATWPLTTIEQSTLDRAQAVQEALADRGRHRGAAIAGLIIAAAAETAGLTVLHYDGDFDLIAAVTRQPTEWVVPAGSAD